MRKIFSAALLILALSPSNAQSDSLASWMSGSWGIWYQVGGSIRTDNNPGNIYLEGVQEIVDSLPTMGHIFSSFTHSAHGYYFMLRDNPYVDVANEIHPDFVPSLENEQKFLEVLSVFKDAGKKIILYIATDGPSAEGGTPDNEEYKLAWESYYNTEFGGDEGLAWRTVCKGYFERFKGIADGYWLDHTSQLPGGMADFVAMIRSVDSTAALATNSVVENDFTDFSGYFTHENGAYIEVDSDGLDDEDETDYKLRIYEITDPYMDFTGGHPTPLQHGAPPNSWGYEEYTYPNIIAEPWGTYDGSKKALKHAFVPMRERWSVSRVDLVFTDVEQAYRVVRNITDAGCAMTWSTTYTSGMMSVDEYAILKELDNRLQMNPMPDFIPYIRPAGAKLVGETFPDSYQYIIFPELTAKTVGNAGFDLEVRATSGLPVSISSSNPDVAVIIGDKIQIVGAGYTLITASQAGNSEYDAASSVMHRLTVSAESTDGTNLAVNGTATQSSTNHGGEASRAIDGNTNGGYSKGSVTHTEVETNPWWQVDLGSAYDIGGISVFARTDDCCKERLSNFTVYVLDEDSTVSYSKTYTSYPDPSVLMNAGGVKGKYVLVQLDDSGVLSLAEVQVFNIPNSVSFKVNDNVSGDSIPLASITINNRFYTTNSRGGAAIQIPSGEYPFTLSKEGFHSLTQTLNVTKDTAIALQLAAKSQYSLSFKLSDKSSNAALSDVFLAIDNTLDTTDVSGELSLTLFEDEYDFTLSKTGYHTLKQTISLLKDTLINLRMERVKYNLGFLISDADSEENIPTVSIAINDSVYMTDSQGSLSLTLEYGDYNYTFNKDGYDEETGSVSLSKDSTLTILMNTSSTGVNSPLAEKIEIYPNPANDILNIEIKSSDHARINIIDSRGQIVLAGALNNGTGSINIEELTPGIYMIKTAIRGIEIIKSFIKR